MLRLLRKDLFDVPMIVHYRKYEYKDELDEDSIWVIYNLDQEYGKFVQSKQQIAEFLHKTSHLCPQLSVHVEDLAQAQLKSQLLSFNSLISYLTSYYKESINPPSESTMINTMAGAAASTQ